MIIPPLRVCGSNSAPLQSSFSPKLSEAKATLRIGRSGRLQILVVDLLHDFGGAFGFLGGGGGRFLRYGDEEDVLQAQRVVVSFWSLSLDSDGMTSGTDTKGMTSGTDTKSEFGGDFGDRHQTLQSEQRWSLSPQSGRAEPGGWPNLG